MNKTNEKTNLIEYLNQIMKTKINKIEKAKIISKEILRYTRNNSGIKISRYKYKENYFEAIHKWLKENEDYLYQLSEKANFILFTEKYRLSK